MWLINTTTLELHEFVDAEHAPKYAILSHCWGEGEVSFKDFRKKRNCTGPGYEKIVRCCTYARDVGYKGQSLEWAWIDTCCIDKRSSAELSEAINSMFDWYENAEICYAYLADVHLAETGPVLADTAENPRRRFEALTASRWFSRGWTLQELLAPSQVLFLDINWVFIGLKRCDKKATPLTHAIASSTSIPQSAILGSSGSDGLAPYAGDWSVAQRMSWASHRTTTRVEDQAYCLFGLFGINLPLLYGEGHQAFHRLQHEILRQQLGDSLFVWQSAPESPFSTSAFANSPSDFADAGRIMETHEKFAALMTSAGNGVQLKIPAYLHNSVYCHLSEDQLLVRLGSLRDKPTVDGSSKRARCFMHLTYNKHCGHFDTVKFDRVASDNRIQSAVHDEDDVVDPSSWRPVQAAGSVYIHGSEYDAYLCTTRRSGMNEAAAAPRLNMTTRKGAPNSYHVLEDARRFNIQ